MSREAEASSARWLEYARSDLHAAATLLSSDTGAGAVCFLAQQSVEKALKAALVHAGEDVPRIPATGLSRRTTMRTRRSSSPASSSSRSRTILAGEMSRVPVAKAESYRHEEEALLRREIGT